MPEENKQNDNNSSRNISPTEWIIGILGMLIFLFSFGYILYNAVTVNKTPPKIKISIDSVVAMENNYVTKITVQNYGASTAEGLVIQGEITSGGIALETSRTTFDYVPEKSKRKGGMIFTKDPRKYTLSIRALGYEEP